MNIAEIIPDQHLRARNLTNGSVLAEDLRLALNVWRRLQGLIGTPRLFPGQGMLLRPCNSIHTFFMRYPIDALFLDEAGKIVAVAKRLRPWRASRIVGGAVATLELPAGTVASTDTSRGQLVGFELMEDNVGYQP